MTRLLTSDTTLRESYEHRSSYGRFEPRRTAGGAPVITQEGVFGTPPPPYRPPERGVETRAWLTIVLALVTMLWLAAFALAQVTAREVAIPAAARGLAALSEVDALLQLDERALCGQAGGQGTLELLGFVVGDVEVRANEVQCTDDGHVNLEALRTLLLTRGADLVYLRGVEALIESGRSPEPASPLSAAGAVRGLLDTLTGAVHEPAALATSVLGAAAGLLACAVLLLGHGLGRLARVGVALVAGATPILVAAIAVRFGLSALARDDDPMLNEFIEIARALAGVPLRDALWLLGGGIALALPGLAERLRTREQY